MKWLSQRTWQHTGKCTEVHQRALYYRSGKTCFGGMQRVALQTSNDPHWWLNMTQHQRQFSVNPGFQRLHRQKDELAVSLKTTTSAWAVVLLLLTYFPNGWEHPSLVSARRLPHRLQWPRRWKCAKALQMCCPKVGDFFWDDDDDDDVIHQVCWTNGPLPLLPKSQWRKVENSNISCTLKCCDRLMCQKLS